MSKIIKKKKTKIIATVGPGSDSSSVLNKLLEAGVDIFRFNLKHGGEAYHLEVIERLRGISRKNKKSVAVLLDFPKHNSRAGFDLAKKINPEYIAISYIKKEEELDYVKDRLEELGISPAVISKIETNQALEHFAGIFKKSEALMVARGDLGRSVPPEQVPFVEKEIVQACNKENKFVIVATEMLLSMVTNKLASRAEVSDVANAVLEGANGVMLSEETAIGKNPKAAVDIMRKTILEAEAWIRKGHISIYTPSKKIFEFGK